MSEGAPPSSSGSTSTLETHQLGFHVTLSHLNDSECTLSDASTKREHTISAIHCLNMMNENLKYNICNIRDPSLLNSDIPDLPIRLEILVSPELAYACKSWFTHLSLSSKDDGLLLKAFHLFCKEPILYWIEVCSLLGVLPESLRGLRNVHSALQGEKSLVEYSQLLYDIERLLSKYYIPISSSALHVYHSAVPFLPDCRFHRQIASTPVPVLSQLESPRDKSWPSVSQTLEGHSGYIIALVISPDGSLLASGDMDQNLLLWESRTGELLRSLHGNSGDVTVLAFSPDSTQIASGSTDHSIKVWNHTSPDAIASFYEPISEPSSVVFSLDGSRIIVGYKDGAICIGDIQEGATLSAFCKHNSSILGLFISPDDLCLVSGSQDGIIRTSDARTGKNISEFQSGKPSVLSMAFCHNSSSAIFGSPNGRIYVISVGSHGGHEPTILKGHTAPVLCLTTAFSDSVLFSGSSDMTIRVWELRKSECIMTFNACTSTVQSIAVSLNDSRLFSASAGSRISVWNLSTHDFSSLLRTSKKPIEPTKEHLCEDLVPAKTKTHRVHRFQVAKASSFRTLEKIIPKGLFGPVEPDKSSLPEDELLRWWGDDLLVGTDAESTKAIASIKGTQISTSFRGSLLVGAFAISPDGQMLAVSYTNCPTIDVWDRTQSRILKKLKGHSRVVTDLAFSTNSAWVISASADRTAHIYDLKSASKIATFNTSLEVVAYAHCVAISSDASKLAHSLAYNNVIRLHTRAGSEWEERRTFQGHTDEIWSLSFSPDGSRILSGSRDGTVRIWSDSDDDGEEHCIAVLKCWDTTWKHGFRTQFSDDGLYVVVKDTSGRLKRVWSTQGETYAEVTSLRPAVCFLDEAGWCWGPIAPGGPTRRLCWIPPSRRADTTSKPLHISLVQGVLFILAGDSRFTCLNLSSLLGLLGGLYPTK